MVTQNDRMVKELVGVLAGVARKSRFQAGRRSLRTRRITRALTKWGLGRGLHVYAKGLPRRLKRKNPGRIDGEWLFDVTCLQYGDGDYLERAVLAVESEWGDEHDIYDDFEKLLVCRTELRLFIFDRAALKFKWLRRCIQRGPVQAGDTYLLAGYSDKKRLFEFYRVDVDADLRAVAAAVQGSS